jgi:translation initiation factor 2B subunit (eIF-2B alpha/beta/delta family)
MKTFKQIVEKSRRNESTQVIKNASISHARVLIENLLCEAADRKEDVRIISGCLSKDFYNNLVSVLENALEKGVSVRTVVLNGRDRLAGNLFAEMIEQHDNGTLTVLDLDVDVAPHFIVVGNKRYRLETHDGHAKAIACFNDEQLGGLLSNIYSQYEELNNTAN